MEPTPTLKQKPYNPSTLVMRKGKYYVAVTVPKVLQPSLGKQKRVSTGTSDKRVAATKQHGITADIYKLFDSTLFDMFEGRKAKYRDSIKHDSEQYAEIYEEDSISALRKKVELMEGIAEAEARLEAMLEEEALSAGVAPSRGPSKASPNSISTLSEVWLAEQERDGSVREKTITSRRSHIAEFIAEVGDVSVSDLKRKHGYDYAKKLHAEGAAKKTIKTKVSTITVFLRWCEREEHVTETPFNNLDVSTYGKKPESYRPIPTPVLRKLFDTEDKDQEETILLASLLLTGCRLDEIATATVKQLKQDDDSGAYYLDLTGSEAVVKNKGSRRMVPLHPQAWNALSRLTPDPRTGRLFGYALDADGKAQHHTRCMT